MASSWSENFFSEFSPLIREGRAVRTDDGLLVFVRTSNGELAQFHDSQIQMEELDSYIRNDIITKTNEAISAEAEHHFQLQSVQHQQLPSEAGSSHGMGSSADNFLQVQHKPQHQKMQVSDSSISKHTDLLNQMQSQQLQQQQHHQSLLQPYHQHQHQQQQQQQQQQQTLSSSLMASQTLPVHHPQSLQQQQHSLSQSIMSTQSLLLQHPPALQQQQQQQMQLQHQQLQQQKQQQTIVQAPSPDLKPHVVDMDSAPMTHLSLTSVTGSTSSHCGLMTAASSLPVVSDVSTDSLSYQSSGDVSSLSPYPTTATLSSSSLAYEAPGNMESVTLPQTAALDDHLPQVSVGEVTLASQTSVTDDGLPHVSVTDISLSCVTNPGLSHVAVSDTGLSHIRVSDTGLPHAHVSESGLSHIRVSDMSQSHVSETGTSQVSSAVPGKGTYTKAGAISLNSVWMGERSTEAKQRDRCAVRALIEIVSRPDTQVKFSKKAVRKKAIWQDIGEEMAQRGYMMENPGDKCSQKWRNLERGYKDYELYRNTPDMVPTKKPPDFYAELSAILKGKHDFEAARNVVAETEEDDQMDHLRLMEEYVEMGSGSGGGGGAGSGGLPVGGLSRGDPTMLSSLKSKRGAGGSEMSSNFSTTVETSSPSTLPHVSEIASMSVAHIGGSTRKTEESSLLLSSHSVEAETSRDMAASTSTHSTDVLVASLAKDVKSQREDLARIDGLLQSVYEILQEQKQEREAIREESRVRYVELKSLIERNQREKMKFMYEFLRSVKQGKEKRKRKREEEEEQKRDCK